MENQEKRGQDYWKRMIHEFLRSGITQKEFVEKQGLRRGTLLDWSKRLGIALNSRERLANLKKKTSPLSFLEVKNSDVVPCVPALVTCEVSFPQGTTLKVEVGATWEQIDSFLKALVGQKNVDSV